ncbi:hypothetical protein [Mesorhizobium kowhaii]|uniref:Uncharacterized protein n=1 Tax=Mesorhizobium kowhaii TaxID=1300272 RepID=A0A2W7C9D8_9HYPH|nr:hypothetical protein [Mesorhizobium kowhaii]PZV39755.1 hypothetical protein B5V02_07460 [Mesorhizobium kowhaii]
MKDSFWCGPMKGRVAHYLDTAERLEKIIPTVDPANGDMIIVYITEASSGGRSFRMSPEMGADFRCLFDTLIRAKAN